MPARLGSIALLFGLAIVAGPATAEPDAATHVFVPASYRVGAYPTYSGSGWIGRAYLNIPDASVQNLFFAESYIVRDDIVPDFFFRTPWIDFPAGPVDVAPDSSFATIGDFLNDYIYNVTDSAKLNEPFGNFVLKFSGFLRVAFEDETLGGVGLPVGVDFGTSGYDGFRFLLGTSIYRLPIVNPDDSFYRENAFVEAVGLFPVEVTYYNRYEPDDPLGRAGIELYSWHGGGLAWPMGDRMIHPARGPGTIVPPWLIYQLIDIQSIRPGDFTADSLVDLADFGWFEFCFTGTVTDPSGSIRPGCDSLDFDGDLDVELDDYATFLEIWRR